MKLGTGKKVFWWLYALITVAVIIGVVFGVRHLMRKTPAPYSALEFYLAERDFLQRYVYDPQEKGFSYWVDRLGVVRDPKKLSLFQANIILWAGGLESQLHDPRNVEMVRRAAEYLVNYLYKGNGEWLEHDSRKHRTKQEFFWNPRNETYIAYALFQASRITGDGKYQRIAQETTAAQRQRFPDGIIYADADPSQDIGYRFPEHLGHLAEYQYTGNQEALDYVRRYDAAYRGRYAKEYSNREADQYYYHGMATIDKLLYGYLDHNKAASDEATAGREYYWNMAHQDDKKFNSDFPGESSDNGRDYYDKRLAMDLIEWSERGDLKFQEDAIDMWKEIKRFWDWQEPNGFMINTGEDRKTCFSIGMPQQMMDLTAPKVVSYRYDPKPFWNYQATVVMYDPNYTWNDHEFRGIGLDSGTFTFRPPWGAGYGPVSSSVGPCKSCVTYRFNFLSFAPGSLRVSAHDYFGNHQDTALTVNAHFALSNWHDLNFGSRWYYAVLAFGALIFVLVTLAVYMGFGGRYTKT